MTLRAALRRAISDAIDRARGAGDLAIGEAVPPFSVERPAKAEHGDWATNAAMQLAPAVRGAPLGIAGLLARHFAPPDGIAEVSVAPPGFVNFRLDPTWLAGQIAGILEAGPAFGRSAATAPQRVNVEFVSANPTGPLTVGNARGAFVGDLLSRVLEAAGHPPTREYYFNDSGAQVLNLGRSVLAVRDGNRIPEDGYHGEYVVELAAELPSEVWEAATADGADAGEVL